LDISFTAE